MHSLKRSEGELCRVGPLRRIAYSFLGLLAGNAFLFLIALGQILLALDWNLHRSQGDLMATQALTTLQWQLVYFVFSVAGWVIAGMPLVLSVPIRLVIRWRWWFLFMGSLSGPIALLLMFRFNFDMQLTPYLIFATAVSSVATATYFTLVRRYLLSFVKD